MECISIMANPAFETLEEQPLGFVIPSDAGNMRVLTVSRFENHILDLSYSFPDPSLCIRRA